MENRIKFSVDNVIHNSRVHAAGDVAEVDDEQFARFVKREKIAVETDEEPTVFPVPVETAAEEPTDNAEGGPVNAQKAVKTPSSRR
jgi:hypothetical protein